MPSRRMQQKHQTTGELVCFLSQLGAPLCEDTYLLGKFQVVAVPAVADYDAAFGSLEVAPKADCDGPEAPVFVLF